MSSTDPIPISIDISDSDAFQPITFPANSIQMIQIQHLQKDQSPILRATVTGEINRIPDDIQQIGFITKHPIRLPYLGYYKFEIQAYANNNRSYLYLSKIGQSPKSNILEAKNQPRHYLSEVSQTYKFRLKIKYPEIQIGLLIGGDSIILPNDQLTLQSIKIYPEIDPHAVATTLPVPNNQPMSPPSQEFVIRKVVHDVSELESVAKTLPIGEYVILRSKQMGEQDHLYLKSTQTSTLEYVCGIGLARPNLIGQGLIQNQPGKIMPVYTTRKEAMESLRQKGPEGFYSPPSGEDYHWESRGSPMSESTNYGVEGDIYLYLDSKGYVRWLKNSSK